MVLWATNMNVLYVVKILAKLKLFRFDVDNISFDWAEIYLVDKVDLYGLLKFKELRFETTEETVYALCILGYLLLDQWLMRLLSWQ